MNVATLVYGYAVGRVDVSSTNPFRPCEVPGAVESADECVTAPGIDQIICPRAWIKVGGALEVASDVDVSVSIDSYIVGAILQCPAHLLRPNEVAHPVE